MNLTQSQLVKIGIGLGFLYGVYKLVPSAEVKTMALGAAGFIVFRQIPYVGTAASV